ncbi:hypothetical protein DMH15_12640 [Streptomyces sp. WAC 06725]|uniref:hypothetical protein n=1 Tax=Streptomyces sp. WAC 06725 TaxID=2203209 RepID=UPI000F743B97|nr:hypothetical protein [Streptomyces sp. WAC 06725]RSO41839.1 hypothetical protein DMH15_12640 [Streptomyces sp. WAC 06725]
MSTKPSVDPPAPGTGRSLPAGVPPRGMAYATHLKRDARYDREAEQGVVLMDLLLHNGSTVEVRLSPGQMELYAFQLAALIAERAVARTQADD